MTPEELYTIDADDHEKDPDFDISHIFIEKNGNICYLVADSDPVITEYNLSTGATSYYDF